MSAQRITIPFDEELLPTTKLSTPRLNCIYEHGSLRYISCGDTEVVRMIYFAVRDKHWNTAPYEIEKESIDQNQDGFSISYTAFHKLNDIEYRTDVVIEAKGEVISYSIKGEALSSFKRNRIGLCVLHPIDGFAGTESEIITPAGARYRSEFPILIAPHQPFKNVRKMECQIGKDMKATLRFDGDTFETEDQRNWADSSYKTYSTPLDLPSPVDVRKGDTIQQRVELIITGETRSDKSPTVKKEAKVRFPKIGYGGTSTDELSAEEITLLQELPFDHYRVELSLFRRGSQQLLQKRTEEARKLNTKLELILFFDDDFMSQLKSLIHESGGLLSSVSSILPLQKGLPCTPVTLMNLLYQQIKALYPQIEIGYGTDGFFAELNRNRPGEQNFDFLSFPLCPQVHASDTRSLLENLERQDDLYETARSFAPGKKIHISPITFRIRASSDHEAAATTVYDARQHRNFGATWTLYTVRNLGRADRLTFFEVKGDKGILNVQPGGGLPPLYSLLKQIKTFNPKWIIEEDTQELSPDRIVLENDRGNRLEFLVTGKTARVVSPV